MIPDVGIGSIETPNTKKRNAFGALIMALAVIAFLLPMAKR